MANIDNKKGAKKRMISNDVLKTIEERFSCRGYTGNPVDEDKLKAIVKSGLHSPSAVDQQKWRLKVITNKALIDDMSTEALEILKNDLNQQGAYERILSRGGICYYNAPVMILVFKAPDYQYNIDLDCGIMIQNLALAATSVGYNCVIAQMSGLVFTGPNAALFREKTGVTTGEEFAIGLLLGEGNMTKEPHAIDWDKVTYIK